MRYFSTETANGKRLVCKRGDEQFDLTGANPAARTFSDLAAAGAISDQSADELAERLIEEAACVDIVDTETAVRPVDPDEVWAAGVTYAISQENREGEGSISDTYIDAYESERPEVYFKATPTRTVGPGENVGIRSDSSWDTAEPELAMVLHHGEIVGYTVGNDMSSREIERDNLLYLPQSKIYKQSCAIGPCIASPQTVSDPHSLTMSMKIVRDSETIFEETTSTSEMVRTCEELVSYYRQCNYISETAVLLTGTSIIPPNDITLRTGDQVEISIENIGVLKNQVTQVQ